jgi:hypothetical protein
MPPVLDPSKSKVDGLAFLGLSLAQKSELGHPESETHQTAFDLNEVLDRDYEFLFSTNDDGWLVGGGEPGPPVTYKVSRLHATHFATLGSVILIVSFIPTTIAVAAGRQRLRPRRDHAYRNVPKRVGRCPIGRNLVRDAKRRDSYSTNRGIAHDRGGKP